MAGIDDNLAHTGNWGAPSPIPRTFFSRMEGEDDDAKLNSEPLSIDRTDELCLGTQEFIATGKSNIEDCSQDGTSIGLLTDSISLSDQKSSSRGGLVERMAARAGFNAPRLNTESIRSADSDICSPYLTIPPGLSPTTLLESPVFLSNSLAQPSPTTGKFPFVYNGTIRCSELSSSSFEKNKIGFDNIFTSSFAFKPATDVGPSFYHGAARKMNPTSLPQQLFPGIIEVSVRSENSFQSQNVDAVKGQVENKNGLHLEADFNESPQNDNETNFVSVDQRAFDTAGGSTENSTPLEEQADEEGCQRGNADSMAAGVGSTASEDGYNWRKYGQKQVKGSEYPRSYYKCTHPNCPVKKKVERSHEGHITEIIYKGAHNHPKPPPNCRLAIGSVNPHSDMHVDNPEYVKPQSGGDGEMHWTSVQKGNIAGDAHVKQDNLEVTSSASAGPEYFSRSSNLPAQNGTHFDSRDAVDASSTFSNDEDEDDQGTHGSVSLAYDAEEDESESKRRKLESYATELSGATRAIREPRVVVQTTSEVDILDDGYRWRKYGQKVVKGNPNPRSYYKCTSAGCTVRKHVERASHDLKSVITTYEGKHNHDVPATRSSSHVNAAAATAQVPPVIRRPEPSQVQNNSMGRIDTPALSSFNLPGRQQLGFSFGMNQPALPNLSMGGLGPPQGKLPVMPLHPYFAQRPANELGFMLPKGEPSVDPTPECVLNQEIMSRMPVGPHI